MDSDFAHDIADVSTIEMLHFECNTNTKSIGESDKNFIFNDDLLWKYIFLGFSWCTSTGHLDLAPMMRLFELLKWMTISAEINSVVICFDRFSTGSAAAALDFQRTWRQTWSLRRP